MQVLKEVETIARLKGSVMRKESRKVQLTYNGDDNEPVYQVRQFHTKSSVQHESNYTDYKDALDAFIDAAQFNVRLNCYS